MTIKEICVMVNDLAHEKGFYDSYRTQDDRIQDFCNNTHDEISELHDAWRNNRAFAPCDKNGKMIELGITPLLSCLEEELADIVIRVFDISQELDIDIEQAILAKHQYNKSREYRHGGKKS